MINAEEGQQGPEKRLTSPVKRAWERLSGEGDILTRL